jgi:lipopolysaccharide export system ATP-binding protein
MEYQDPAHDDATNRLDPTLGDGDPGDREPADGDLEGDVGTEFDAEPANGIANGPGHDETEACRGEGIVGDSLVKVYGKRRVVNGVTIGLRPGEVVGLLGPNGAGKTTTFYMIVGVIRPNGGRVLVRGRVVTKLPMHKRARLGVGYLPQHSSIFQKLTVWQNLMAVLELMPLKRQERVERCEALLERFGIAHLAQSRGDSLSGGERRRAEIARCLASEPSFILLDEPFTGVDPKAVRDIQEMVRTLKGDGLGVLITDHSVRETLDIADRAYIIDAGQILTAGTPDELKRDELAQRAYFGDVFTRGMRDDAEDAPPPLPPVEL